MALPTIISLNWRLVMQNFAQLAGETDNLKRKVIKNTYILRPGFVKAKTWLVKHKRKESNLVLRFIKQDPILYCLAICSLFSLDPTSLPSLLWSPFYDTPHLRPPLRSGLFLQGLGWRGERGHTLTLIGWLTGWWSGPAVPRAPTPDTAPPPPPAFRWTHRR